MPDDAVHRICWNRVVGCRALKRQLAQSGLRRSITATTFTLPFDGSARVKASMPPMHI